MPVKIRLRRGTAAEWTAANPVLALAEVGLETDTRRLKFGDNKTPWNGLLYGEGGTSSSASSSDVATETAARIAGDDLEIAARIAGDAAETAARVAADAVLTAAIAAVFGVPAGGTTGQALTKASNANYNMVWATISGGGLTNLEGGTATTVYGGTVAVDGGSA